MLRAQRVRGQVAVDVVQDLTRRAFDGRDAVDPPSGALSETPELVAAEFANDGGVLLYDDDRLVATCRIRRMGSIWVLRRCAVDPELRRRGLGSRLVSEATAWAADEGVLRLHIGVRDARPGSRAFWEGHGFTPVAHHGFWTELAKGVRQTLHGDTETFDLGRRLASDLRAGDLLVLSGPLGAGKTTLTQGIGAALEVRGAVTSPTFVLSRVHPGPVPLVHVDAYRLRDAGGRLELDDLDLDASLEDSITVVEWGEGLVEGLAESRLDVRLERPADDTRTVVVTPVGARWSTFG